jgi:ubiquinone biosynthesis protein
MATVNVVALDQRTSARLLSLQPRKIRPKVIRRIVNLPGSSRMRRPELEPTPLGTAAEQKRIEIFDGPLSTRSDILVVLFALGGLFFRMMWLRLKRESSPKRTGQELRAVFERLGGFWMKVGQLMSLRRDVISAEICDELAQLQHRAIGFPPEEAMRIIERELGVPIHEVFAEFDALPFAAASLSQVHAARLKKGNKDVVVKVLRPGVREKFGRDMASLRFLARVFGQLPSLRRVRLQDALRELEEILKEETDYRYEISSMREMRQRMRGHKIYIPYVYKDLSTANVIVMERISGVLMSDYIRIRNEAPDRVDHWLKANNIVPKVVGSRLLISFMRQLFENNLFHADLHPGNIILLRNSRIALIDLGSVGSLDREFLTLYRGLQRALAANDYGKAADLQLRLCAQLPSRKLAELRSELIRCLRLWSQKTKIAHLPFHERSVNNGAAEVSRILYRYGAEQTWEFLKIARTLSTLDGSLAYLHRDLNYIKILQKYFGQASQRAVMESLKPSNLTRAFGQIAATIEEYHLMLGPTMRSSAFNFEATVSKVSRVFATIVKVMSFVLLVALAAGIYRFTLFHSGRRYTILDTIVDDLPDFELGWWLVVIAAGAIVLFATWRIVWDLMQPESNRRSRS